MDTFGDDVKAFVYMYLNNEAATDEVTQKVFLSVYIQLQTFKGNSSLISWIYSIAATKCKEHLRSDQIRHFKIIKRKKCPQPVNPKLIEQSAVNEGLFEKIMELPIKYREVVILYDFKEFSIKEISFILNEKECTLQSRMLKARKLLRGLLNEGGIILE